MTRAAHHPPRTSRSTGARRRSSGDATYLCVDGYRHVSSPGVQTTPGQPKLALASTGRRFTLGPTAHRRVTVVAHDAAFSVTTGYPTSDVEEAHVERTITS